MNGICIRCGTLTSTYEEISAGLCVDCEPNPFSEEEGIEVEE